MYGNQRNAGMMYGAFPAEAGMEEMQEQMPLDGFDEQMPMEPMPPQMEEMLAQHPAVLQANQMLQEREQEQLQQFIQQSLQRLQQMYPESNIMSLEDLATTPEGQQTLEYWGRGIPLEQAYGAAFSGMIAENRSRAAKQQAMNASNSKGHIAQPHGANGSGSMMRAEEKAIWREFFPKATDAQLEAKWKKTR